MGDRIFGFDPVDWERWQREHTEFYESLKGLEQIPLWPGGRAELVPEYGQRAPVLALLPTQKEARGTVLICPGGGYKMKSVFEGRPVAQKFRDYGFNAAVLDYRCSPYTLEQALEDVQRAIRILRYNADKWNIRADKIAVGGFSAGGHLSTSAATLFHQAAQKIGDAVDQESCRPDAVIQCYGAIGSGQAARLCNLQADTAEQIRFSSSLNVSMDTPPFYMWMTREDEIIRRGDLYTFAEALEDYRVPYELHVFPHGIHGIGLADGSSKFGENDPHAARWHMLACEWLKTLDF